MKQDIYDKQLPEFDGDGTLLVWGFVRTADQEQVGKFGAGGIWETGWTRISLASVFWTRPPSSDSSRMAPEKRNRE